MPLFMILLTMLLPSHPGDSVSAMHVQWLPQKKVVSVFSADNRAHRLSILRNFDANSYTASMGMAMPLLNVKKGRFFMQGVVAGSTYLTLQRLNGAGSVVNTDFFADAYTDIRLYKTSYLRVGMGHTSQHLSDDGLLALGVFKNYARDYYQAMYCWQKNKYHLQTYAGVFWNYNFKTTADISGKAHLQAGFEHAPFSTGRNSRIFYAADIKWRQDIGGSTANMQCGFRYRNVQGKNLRLVLNYTLGTDERGYFQPANRSFGQLGFYAEL